MSFSTNFWEEVTKMEDKKLFCPFCHADITGRYGECKCIQRDKRCPECNKSWHKCGLNGMIKTGHPCIWCLGGKIKWFS